MDAGKSKLAVGVVSLAAHDLLDRCLQSVQQQRGLMPSDACVVANGVGVLAVCDKWERAGFTVHRPGKNLGCTGAWNRMARWAWQRGADGIMILNDDMVLTEPGTLEMFLDVYRDSGWRQMRFVMGRGFSAFVLTKEVWDEVGEFDEGFWPAYYEDNDYWRRFTLKGIVWDHVVVDSMHDKSSTMRYSDDFKAMNGHTFTLNGDRYREKWGGGPHHEEYTVPWNGGAPTRGTRDRLKPFMVERVERAYGPEENWP